MRSLLRKIPVTIAAGAPSFVAAIAVLAAPAARGQEAAAEPAAAEPVELFKLRDGRILWGWLGEHDAEHLAVRRLANDGLVRLPWSMLDPAQERELRLALGYLELAGEEITVTADRIPIVDGSELVGLIVARTDDLIHVKTEAGTIKLPKLRVAGPSTPVRVPALDVYTREELYQRRLAELGDRLDGEGAEVAEANWETARYCEAILDFTHAHEHYQAAREADPGFRAEEMPAVLERSRRAALSQEQADFLNDVDRLRARSYFPEALALLEEFPLRWPNSPLMEDWAKLESRVRASQIREARELVAQRWHHWSERLARQAAREVSFEGAIEYAGSGLGDAIVQAVLPELQEVLAEAQPGDVRRLFAEREGGRYRKASYGLGTWLLGEEEARSGLEPEEEDAEAEGEKSEARRELEEKIRRYLRNQELVLQSRRSAGAGADPEAFWSEWSVNARTHWILAYYAENAGDVEVRDIRFQNCRECGGTGVREMIFTGDARSGEGGAATTRLVPCPTCQRIGIVRRVSYR